MSERGIPRQGMPIRPDGVVTSGTMSPSLGIGIGMGYVPAAAGNAGHPRSRSTSAAAPCRGDVAKQAAVRQGDEHMSDASYPDGLYYNEEHDWARVDGDIATFGITWYAQDTLGEVVYFSPAAGRHRPSARAASTASWSRPRRCRR